MFLVQSILYTGGLLAMVTGEIFSTDVKISRVRPPKNRAFQHDSLVLL